ncbi:hypothetical protein O4J56_09670 [Nocardiopsis sp. RSe5-2]|uniref:Uncharacterized protein n=1 Tax=Nocardiopsis endophytica TaxID=3018445 RepID=A0ABT4U1S8_9ACTN|nr:hypothetical protein [Nocardiopsis endophytica]MDA2810902.1 hypothetical protein [Nocardiopsis endophytica]
MSAPPLFARMLDDAALFPPGNAPMERAVPRHRALRQGPSADYVGPFIVADAWLGDLEAVLAEEAGESAGRAGPAEALEITITVPGGPAAVGPALQRARRMPGVRVVGAEAAAVPASAPAGGADPVAAVRTAAQALTEHLPEGALGYVEVPRGADPAPAMAALAGAGHRAKFRTGGTAADAFPSEAELAARIAAAVDAQVPFKCTAGLHNAVRHTGAGTGFEHHGFLNVLLAADALLRGAHITGAEGVLGERDGKTLAREARTVLADEHRSRAVRAAFTGFGTCSVDEPLEDLEALGLPPGTPADDA